MIPVTTLSRRFALALAAIVLCAAPAASQTGGSVQTARTAGIFEQPRGDSMRITSVPPGHVLQVVSRRGDWYLVIIPDGLAGAKAPSRGWIHAGSLVGATTAAAQNRRSPVPGRFHVRGIAYGGGVIFDAENSFEAVLGSAFRNVYGGGGQVVLPNGVFAQVTVEQARGSGFRTLVSGEQIFTLNTPAEVTVRPVLATVGVRANVHSRYAPYVGGGLGWHAFTESSPGDAERITRNKVGYHVLGGVEIAASRWLGFAGEAQWATVPKALGETGVSAVFGEDNLGGTTFRFKILVGY